jgi:hypothetical protein
MIKNWLKKLRFKRLIKNSSLTQDSKNLWLKDAEDTFKAIAYKDKR